MKIVYEQQELNKLRAQYAPTANELLDIVIKKLTTPSDGKIAIKTVEELKTGDIELPSQQSDASTPIDKTPEITPETKSRLTGKESEPPRPRTSNKEIPVTVTPDIQQFVGTIDFDDLANRLKQLPLEQQRNYMMAAQQELSRADSSDETREFAAKLLKILVPIVNEQESMASTNKGGK